MEAGYQTYCRERSCRKMAFVNVDIHELEFLVRFCFGGDPELLSTYQQLDSNFEEMVKRNMNNIKDYPDELEYFRIDYDGRIAGFSVIDFKKAILFSFGLNIKYRKAEILAEWMSILKERFNDIFYCSLWSRNKRAIYFLQKNGMKVIREKDLITYLIFE